MIRAHKITLDLNNKQRTYCARASGCARFAYNWGLAEWQKSYEAGGKPNEAALRRQLNAIKAKEFPWMKDVTKCAPQMAMKDLGKAFQNFFAKRSGYPKRKKKGVHDSFTLSNDHFKVRGKKIHIPHLGFVKMREELRFTGKPLWATISRQADTWQVSISVETADALTEKPAMGGTYLDEAVGIDLGITHLATLSTGEVVPNPNALEKKLSRLKRLSRSLSRKEPRSKNRQKAKRRLSKLHKGITDLRSDALHKFTTRIATHWSVVCLEDLNVKGMTKNKHLARRLCDSSFGEIRRQLEYKTQERGGRVLYVGTFFPSSKLCSYCSVKNHALTLSDRVWSCENCGSTHDRDVNAAINIRNHAVSYTVASTTRQACEEESSDFQALKRRRSETVFREAGTNHQSTA